MVSFVGPLVVLTAITVVIAFWREPRIQRQIRARETTGVDEREQVGTVPLPIPPEAALTLASRLLSQRRLSYGTDVTIDNERNRVDGRLGFNWQTWGQAVSVEVAPAGGGTQVTIRSWPTTNRAITDWGRGRRVVASLIEQLESAASGQLGATRPH